MEKLQDFFASFGFSGAALSQIIHPFVFVQSILEERLLQ